MEAFERSPLIDDIVLMTGDRQQEYCRQNLVQKFGLKKVKKICAGGRERYESVARAIEMLRESPEIGNTDGYVFIHDGARPFVTEDIIERTFRAVEQFQACAAGMPVKDTIKLTDAEGKIVESPDRSRVWQAQTPQAFSVPLIAEAFRRLRETDPSGITDDAMVVESQMGVCRANGGGGSYRNIKITTPEDLLIAEALLKSEQKKEDCFVTIPASGNGLRLSVEKIKENLKKVVDIWG